MNRKSDCWVNAVVENFCSTKTELVHRLDFLTRAAARSSLFEFILDMGSAC
jgi:hypothetical protein